MKKNTVILAAVAALLSGALRADDPQTLYGIWKTDGYFSWKDSAGEDVSWVPGSIACFTNFEKDGNCGSWPALDAYGLVIDSPAKVSFWSDSRAVITVGAGGVTFTKNGTFPIGRKEFTERHFAISADQTWQGPASGAYANLSIGYGAYGDYWKMPLAVGEDVHNLEIKGNLNVWLYSPSNDLSAVDVTLRSPARLYLPSWYVFDNLERPCDAHLKARRLTLDGSTMRSGGTVTYFKASVSQKLVSDFDADHIAQTLELTNGASVVATGECRFAIPTVVAGGEAANTISGDLSLTRESVGIELVDGASLAFGDSIVERGVSASLEVSGEGTLSVPANTILSGGIDIGDDVELVVVGGGLFSAPVIGGGEIVFDAPGETNAVKASSLSGFTGGRITVRAGGLYIIGGRPSGINFVVEEGACLVDSYPLIISDEASEETEIVVSSNQTLLVYGNGLTAATTVVLDGGTMLFKLPATVSSPVNVRQRSDIATESLSVTGIVAGAVDCAITNQTYGLHVVGDGCVKFAGGATFAGTPTTKTTYDTFYVDQGSALLTNGKYKFGWGGFMIHDPDENDDKWGRYLGIMDGGEVTFVDQGNGQGSSRELIKVKAKPNGNAYNNESTLEIGVGGKLTLPWNCQVHIGARCAIGRLLINGGEWRVNGRYNYVYFTTTSWGYTTGVIEMRSGLMELSSPLRRGIDNGQARLIWYGGTIKTVGQDFTEDGKLYSKPINKEYIDGNPLRTWVRIAGDDCVLDLSSYPATRFHGVPLAGCDRSEWFGTGTLTVKGGKTFVMPSFPAGVNLVAEGDGTVIEVPSDAKVFDNDKCEANMYAKPHPLDIYSSAGAEISGALPINVFAVTNGAAAFTNLLAGARTAIGAVEVRAGGVWDNESTIAGEDVSITNMAFRGDSVLRARVSDRKTQTLGIEGVLTLPSAAVFNAVKDVSLPASSPAVISAGGGIVGEAQWSGSRRPTLRVDGNSLVLDYAGLVFVIR